MEIMAIETLTITFGQAQTLTYTNHRGETAKRRVIPWRLYYGSTQWHPQPQWMIKVWDVDRQAERDYALSGIKVGE